MAFANQNFQIMLFSKIEKKVPNLGVFVSHVVFLTNKYNILASMLEAQLGYSHIILWGLKILV